MDIDASIRADFAAFKDKLYKEQPNAIAAIARYERLNDELRDIMLKLSEPERTARALLLIEYFSETYE